MIEFTVPLVPPSVNHYVKHTRSGRHYVTAEARQFIGMVQLYARGRTIIADEYHLEVHVFRGKGERGDGDNYWKCIADALVKAGVIDSDHKVSDWVMRVRRDWKNPRTQIFIQDATIMERPI